MIRSRNARPKHMKQSIATRPGSVAKAAVMAGSLAFALSPIAALAAPS